MSPLIMNLRLNYQEPSMDSYLVHSTFGEFLLQVAIRIILSQRRLSGHSRLEISAFSEFYPSVKNIGAVVMTVVAIPVIIPIC